MMVEQTRGSSGGGEEYSDSGLDMGCIRKREVQHDSRAFDLSNLKGGLQVVGLNRFEGGDVQ